MMRINSKFLLLKYYIFIYKIIMDINNRIKKKSFLCIVYNKQIQFVK